ncbi:hypothetical protein A2V56_00040 [Candidatus Woesebacteria bacterium RBG_19FT_COMBO_42_9]|uniref:Uncharacterized protein n=1 Tax=Candidatus Woesebacteria bacterium RBG_16_42_24 TaxID=1802485 RepID=A0A1F7XKH4_9BACT|nr:MAG: hypothetical protein A2V97_02495 [Candidatus Woesebacteria bacterium RBG_16_42_24]OGM16626.1 MAG: hypothetical protein A2V56_00040 [Candidatus Woesebacteria bacterium RBG_19FT_COMBO_42_9]
MSAEQESKVTIERQVWRGSGIALAIESVRLLATMPSPSTVERALELLGVGLAIPIWIRWGQGRGWVEEDLGRLLSIKPQD